MGGPAYMKHKSRALECGEAGLQHPLIIYSVAVINENLAIVYQIAYNVNSSIRRQVHTSLMRVCETLSHENLPATHSLGISRVHQNRFQLEAPVRNALTGYAMYYVLHTATPLRSSIALFITSFGLSFLCRLRC